MHKIKDIKNTIIQGDTIEELKKIPTKSIDLIFADPPYFMQTEGKLIRTEGTKFNGVEDEWDKFEDYKEYDQFSKDWLKECKRVLKDTGAIWVIGAFQNIYRIGYIMQNLGFWILNDVVWNKPNPVPNFKGTRFTNANEIMLWCSKGKGAKYTFNYKTMKHINGGKQMKSVWDIGICIGNERIKNKEGKKAHATQKPEKLLENIILATSKAGAIVLDPFMGSGTTGAIAKRTSRNFIGIEREKRYIDVAENRIENENKEENNPIYQNLLDIKPPRVSTETLIKSGYIKEGEVFYTPKGEAAAKINKNGHLQDDEDTLSIHKMSAKILKLSNNNGWDYWKVRREKKLIQIEEIRVEYRKKELAYEHFEL